MIVHRPPRDDNRAGIAIAAPTFARLVEAQRQHDVQEATRLARELRALGWSVAFIGLQAGRAGR